MTAPARAFDQKADTVSIQRSSGRAKQSEAGSAAARRALPTLAALICLLVGMSAQQAAAQQACPTLTVTTSNDVVNGNTSSPCALIASPGSDGISLREALLAANNATGSGTITINFAPSLAGTTIELTERFAPITRSQITLTGLTSSGQPNITLDATNASDPGAIFFIAASNFTMTGLNVTNLPTNFNAMQIGGSGFDLTGHSLSSPAQISSITVSGNGFSNGTGNNTFAIYVQASLSNETIGGVSISNNAFDNLFEAININPGGPPSAPANNSIIQDVHVSGNTFTLMTSFAGVELGNSIGRNDQILRTQISDNSFSDSAQGVFLDNNQGAQSTVIDGTLIEGNTFTAVTGNNTSIGMVAGVSGGADNNVISNTQIANNVINQGTSAQPAFGIFMNDDQDNNEINNKVTGVTIVNNTFAGALAMGAITAVSNSGGITAVAASNDIFSGNQVNGLVPSQLSYSIINQSGFTGVNNDFDANPMFVNAAAGNFELQIGSPALHAGTGAGAPANDIDCQRRGSPPSIGAYEFDGPNVCVPTVTAVSPSGGPLAGGTVVTITGTNFTGTTAVDFGLTPAASFTINSATSITATSPAGSGTVDVVANNSGNLSAANPGDQFTYGLGATHDFNGDGKSDVLWRDTAGDVGLWLMNGTQILQGAAFSSVPLNWSIVGQRDFTGTGKADILWRDTAGDVGIWLMNGTQIVQGGSFSSVPLNWTIVGTGDFNGDGKADILWLDNQNNVGIWFMNGTQILQAGVVGQLPADWTVVGADMKGDIFLRDLSTGDLGMWVMNGTQIAQNVDLGPLSLTWSVAGIGDFDGNGSPDILLRDTSGNVQIWFMNGTQVLSTTMLGNVPTSWSIAETGDFSGSGRSDILWVDNVGDVGAWFMNGTAISSTFIYGDIGTAWSVQSLNAD